MKSNKDDVSSEQVELSGHDPLLDANGNLSQIGWARHPILDTNLERARSPFRIKKWDYYCLFLPTHVIAFALADLTYAGSAFCYIIDRRTRQVVERAISLPLAMGIHLPRNSDDGDASFQLRRTKFAFSTRGLKRHIRIVWPKFAGEDLEIDITLSQRPDQESMVITVPMGDGKFYWNRKTNNLTCSGKIRWGDTNIACSPEDSLATFDWGRGIWPFQSKWVWLNASGYSDAGAAIGLNLGTGFGDTSRATENALIFGDRIHKLKLVTFQFDSNDRMKPWTMNDEEGRLSLTFTPSLVRTGKTDLVFIKTIVDQMFGYFSGRVKLDDGKELEIKNLWGFAEEHFARW